MWNSQLAIALLPRSSVNKEMNVSTDQYEMKAYLFITSANHLVFLSYKDADYPTQKFTDKHNGQSHHIKGLQTRIPSAKIYLYMLNYDRYCYNTVTFYQMGEKISYLQ